ncbi:MAG: acetylxylan esterase [Verrucomicrobiota bacterium]
MKLPSLLTFLCLTSVLYAQQGPATVTLKASTDRPEAIYQSGESVTFTVEAFTDNKPVESGSISCILSKDGIQPQPAKLLPLKDGKAVLTGTLSESGFLSLKATMEKAQALAGAGFDPLSIKPSLPVPDDFDSFWNKQKAALKEVPINPTLVPVKAAAGVEAFDVKLDCIGAPVSGYFGKPKDAKPKSLPAILTLHGAGVRSANPNVTSWALKEGGMLAMDINAHGIPNGEPPAFYENLTNTTLKDYRYEGRTDREQVYFKAMFLRVIRAIDFLTSQPEWDGKIVIAYGTSQGGFQAFAAAALDERVTFFCAGVPAGCDHTGSVAGRVNGWPKFVPTDATGKPDAAILETSRYIDCVNFAQRTKCKGAAVTVGFIDVTCPPSSVYAAYNALNIPKTIYTMPLAGHSGTPEGYRFMEEAALKHIRDSK